MRRPLVLVLALAALGACTPAPPEPTKLAVGTIRPSVEVITPEPSKTPRPTPTPTPAPTRSGGPSGRPTPGGTRITPSPSPSPTERTLVINIISAQYGYLDITVTVPDALCTAAAEMPDASTLPAGYFAPRRPDSLGHVIWSYGKTAIAKKGGGLYTVTCASGLQRLTKYTNFAVE